jgi:hypothetical protein
MNLADTISLGIGFLAAALWQTSALYQWHVSKFYISEVRQIHDSFEFSEESNSAVSSFRIP